MSRQNKVNPDHYKVAGRLTADELAREKQRQTARRVSRGKKARPAVRRPSSRKP
jgi:hypothetical protein